MIAVFTLALLAFLAIGVPVAFSLGTSGLLGMLLFMPGDGALDQIPILAYKALDDFVLCAVPLYILMSAILLKGKVGEDLFDLGNKWLRHLPGGLGIATIVACGIFAAITGSSVACAVTVGAIAIPEMLKRGYDRSVVLGAVAGGGTLGILIPPSIPMILYGSITGESIGQLFMSGVLPGVLMTLFFIFIVVHRSRHLKLEAKAPLAERLTALKGSFWGLLLPIIVVGGIYTGAFTPTEAAAVGTVYALFITFVIYRTLSIKDLPGILLETVGTTAMIFAIMIGASLFGFVLTILQVPQALTMMVAEVEVSRWVFFILINLLLLFLGCILETVSIIFITVPILYPIIKQLGFDPIWFNVVMQINMEMALITPPVGMNLFVLKGVSPDSRMEDIIRGVVPYIGVMALEILLISVVPEIATWLPSVVK
ncbi:MAG: TRAP transporter large permease subunit [Acidaminococcus sp.]|uniref:TRAP transporter large permease subunit n=1 Tax=Acidaminococcus intestini TaxID=187327 RepID=A0A943I238_9FIRM|nr:TRAP transporter large permease subunit [Acidaminococcus sp.]MBS5520535.1 TRAP transporter large permease subunit [Acidaminococcus intestini]MDY2738621.1 TRAP transporter large permease subunit [Acidaminococcus sp.]